MMGDDLQSEGRQGCAVWGGFRAWGALAFLAAAFAGAGWINVWRVLDKSWMIFDGTAVLSMIVFVLLFWLAGGGWCGSGCGVSLLPAFLQHKDAGKDCVGRCLLISAVGLGVYGVWMFLLRLAMAFLPITRNPCSTLQDLIHGMIWATHPLFLALIVLLMVLMVRQRMAAGKRKAFLSAVWVGLGLALSLKIDTAKVFQVDSVVIDLGFLVGVVVFCTLCVLPVLGFRGTMRSKFYLFWGKGEGEGVRAEAIGFCTVVMTAEIGYGLWISLLRFHSLLLAMHVGYPEDPCMNTNDMFGWLCWGISPLLTAIVLVSVIWVLRQRLMRA